MIDAVDDDDDPEAEIQVRQVFAYFGRAAYAASCVEHGLTIALMQAELMSQVGRFAPDRIDLGRVSAGRVVGLVLEVRRRTHLRRCPTLAPVPWCAGRKSRLQNSGGGTGGRKFGNVQGTNGLPFVPHSQAVPQSFSISK